MIVHGGKTYYCGQRVPSLNADREDKTFFKTLIVHTVMNLTPGKPKELKKILN